MTGKVDFLRIFEFFCFLFGIFRFFAIFLILVAIFSLKFYIFCIFGGPRGPPIDWGAPGTPNGYNVNGFYIFLQCFEISDFSKNRFFSLFNRSGGPGTIKIEFSIKKYPTAALILGPGTRCWSSVSSLLAVVLGFVHIIVYGNNKK